MNDEFARVKVKTKLQQSETPSEGISFKLKTSILDPSGKVVAVAEDAFTRYDEGEIEQTLVVEKPLLWDIRQPNLYK